MSLLRAFGQRKLQPLLLRLAMNRRVKEVCERLLLLVTVEDCGSCPLRDHCEMACVGFRNLCRRLKSTVIEKLLWLLIAILLCLLLLPIFAAGLFFLGVLALFALPLAIPLAGAILIALGILLIIIGAIAILI
jgi:hypothetical protein